MEYDGPEVGVRPGDVVVDCGAHVGVFARYALQRGAARVICVEMDDRNVKCLRRNLAGESDRAEIWHTTLWKSAAAVNFFSNVFSDCHSVSEGGNSTVVKNADTLDGLLSENKAGRVDFIKVDVEGAEPQVLAGAVETLRRHKPRLSVATYHDGGEESAIRRLFRESGLRYQFLYRHLEAGNPYVLFARAVE